MLKQCFQLNRGNYSYAYVAARFKKFINATWSTSQYSVLAMGIFTENCYTITVCGDSCMHICSGWNSVSNLFMKEWILNASKVSVGEYSEFASGNFYFWAVVVQSLWIMCGELKVT